ncbi:MAG TPA: hypothetical protein VM940_15815 [Chthoniobacterales bacterium]|jgi:hypothetical protein|nr:hypothetical protein [Chthoniobacterales bacterium]
MGQKLPPEQRELYRRVDEVLHYLWDPIHIAREPQARDEYHTYLPRVFSLLQSGAPSRDIVEFLVGTQLETMDISQVDGARKHAEKITEILEEWREWIHQRGPIV